MPFQHSTIQSAVDASSPGDIVWVFSGEYRENVHVDAANFSIRCLILRHGETGLHADQGLTVSNLTVIGSDREGIYVGDGNGFKIEDSEVLGTSSTGIYVDTGHGGRISNTIVRGADYNCGSAEVRGNFVDGGGSGGGYSGLYVDSGPGTVLSGNTVRGVQGNGFELYCDECTISFNTAIENGGYDGYRAGFYFDGDYSSLSGNRAFGNTGPGFRVDGDDNTLDGNEASRNLLEGFRIEVGAWDNVLIRNL